MTKRACLYLRCSTDEQVASVPAQRDQLQAFAEREGFEVVREYVDEGITGTSPKRPGLQRMIADAQHGAKWDTVLAWDTSRLHRPDDPCVGIAFEHALRQAGKSIVTAQGAQMTGNALTDGLMRFIEYGQAGEESVKKSRDVLRGQFAAAKSGQAWRAPYGMDNIYRGPSGDFRRRVRRLADDTKELLTEDGGRVIESWPKSRKIRKADDETVTLMPGDPDKLAVVRRIFAQYLGGKSIRQIVFGLNEDGIASPKGQAWRPNMIRRILTNPHYAGRQAFGRHSLARFHQIDAEGNVTKAPNPDKRMTERPAEDWLVRDDAWEAVVTPEDWQAVQDRLSQRRTTPALTGKGGASPYLVSGLLKCSCGSGMYGSKGTRDIRYRCYARRSQGKSICDAKSIRADLIDNYVEQRIRELFLSGEAEAALMNHVEALLDAAIEAASDGQQTDGYKARLDALDAERRRIVGAIGRGIIEDADAADELVRIKRERADIEAKLASSGKAGVNPKSVRRKVIAACRDRIRYSRSLWGSAEPRARKEIVRGFVASMTADQQAGTVTTEFIPLAAESGVPSLTQSLCGQHTTPAQLAEIFDYKLGRIVTPAKLGAIGGAA